MNKPDTIDEIVTKLWKNGINQELPDYYPDTITVAEAKAALSAMVAEIIGEDEKEFKQWEYEQHRNDLKSEQRQRAIDRGFTL